MKALIALLLLALGGCATIQEHPVATGVAIAIVARSIAASAHHDNQGGGPQMANVNGPSCVNGSCR